MSFSLCSLWLNKVASIHLANMHQLVIEEFQNRFGASPTHIVRAPGRVNLIGEHTDYNDGFVLPMAIDRAIWIALRPRPDRRVLLHSLDFAEPTDFSLDNLTHAHGWSEYVRGIAWILQQQGFTPGGWEGALASDVPVGAGLSSSAALELALLRAFWTVSDFEWDGARMAQLAQQADHGWVGIQSGIMDQMISALGMANHALLIDCRSLDVELVPLPDAIRVIILNTATRRGLVDSAYNERVAQCRIAANFFGVPALRDVSLAVFNTKAENLDKIIRRRARHVISENERTLQATSALRRGDAKTFGELMNASHESLRGDYEVSSHELNTMVQIARQQAGCYGARMTGAGFGGCAVALIEAVVTEDFVKSVEAAYTQETGLQPNIYICQAGDGEKVVSASQTSEVSKLRKSE